MQRRNYDEEKSACKRTLLIVLCIAILYPSVFYFLVYQLKLDDPTTRYLLTILSGIFLGRLALWALRRDNISLAEIGINLKRFGEAVLLIIVVSAIIGLLHYTLDREGWLSRIASPLLIMQQWIFVGIGEELLFRGYLYNRLVKSFKKMSKVKAQIAALAISSLIFSAFHIPVRLFNEIPISQVLISLGLLFAAGIYFGLVYIRTKNILFTGLAHGNWNISIFGVPADLIQIFIVLLVVEIRNTIYRFFANTHP